MYFCNVLKNLQALVKTQYLLKLDWEMCLFHFILHVCWYFLDLNMLFKNFAKTDVLHKSLRYELTAFNEYLIISLSIFGPSIENVFENKL